MQIEYVSFADGSGYGQAALDYVDLLDAAGHDVAWTPWTNRDLWRNLTVPVSPSQAIDQGHALLWRRAHGPHGARLRALLTRTRRHHELTPGHLRILHVTPRFWPLMVKQSPEATHVGMTVWENDRLPQTWHGYFQSMTRLIVPCQHNLDILRHERPDLSTHLVPHVMRDAPSIPDSDIVRLRHSLGIRANDTVFCCINEWDPRKQMGPLVQDFLNAFRAEEPVVLVIKTGRRARFDDPLAPPTGTRDPLKIVAHLQALAAQSQGHKPGRICILAEDELSDAFMATLHGLTDCYVSWSRCEGFGLGSFEAARRGKPVIGVGYGGPLDYLGEDWPGRISHVMTSAESIPGYEIEAGQQWPTLDTGHAVQLMRDFLRDTPAWNAKAREHATHLPNTFGRATILNALERAIG